MGLLMLSWISFSWNMTVLRRIFIPSHWLLTHMTTVQTMDSGKGRMNLVGMAIINPQKEYLPTWRLNHQPPGCYRLFWKGSAVHKPFPRQALVFMCLQYKSFENTVVKGEIARNEQFLLLPQCFLPVWKIVCHFNQIRNCRLQTFQFGTV